MAEQNQAAIAAWKERQWTMIERAASGNAEAAHWVLDNVEPDLLKPEFIGRLRRMTGRDPAPTREPTATGVESRLAQGAVATGVAGVVLLQVFLSFVPTLFCGWVLFFSDWQGFWKFCAACCLVPTFFWLLFAVIALCSAMGSAINRG